MGSKPLGRARNSEGRTRGGYTRRSQRGEDPPPSSTPLRRDANCENCTPVLRHCGTNFVPGNGKHGSRCSCRVIAWAEHSGARPGSSPAAISGRRRDSRRLRPGRWPNRVRRSTGSTLLSRVGRWAGESKFRWTTAGRNAREAGWRDRHWWLHSPDRRRRCRRLSRIQGRPDRSRRWDAFRLRGMGFVDSRPCARKKGKALTLAPPGVRDLPPFSAAAAPDCEKDGAGNRSLWVRGFPGLIRRDPPRWKTWAARRSELNALDSATSSLGSHIHQ